MSSESVNIRDRWTIRRDEVLCEMVQEAVDQYGYMDNSEFVRESVRMNLRRLEEIYGRSEE